MQVEGVNNGAQRARFADMNMQNNHRSANFVFPCPSLSALVGREQAIQQGWLLLQHPDVRLLTLTGVGGVGKTRLAQELVEKASSTFVDGMLSLSLASLTDPDLLAVTLLQALGVNEEPEHLPQSTLCAFLRAKNMMLFLDNFEQIITAAPLLGRLLEHCPALKILVTSREMLRIRGESVFQVQPLPLPDLHAPADSEELPGNPALQLFLQRLHSLQPGRLIAADDLHTIAEICIRLDGIPLAIELAALRCNLFSLPDLLRRLEFRLQVLTHGPRDLPSRQQTLRRTLDWSYELLADEEQRLFRRLAIFVGGCPLEAASFVAGGTHHTLNLLSLLLEKSLLYSAASPAGESRLCMLETLREYSQEHLQASEEFFETSHLHATYYLHLAERVESYLVQPEAPGWLQHLELELHNLRRAMRWWKEQGDVENLLRLGSALRHFWVLSEHGREGYHWLAEALADAESCTTPVYAKALLAAGILASYESQHTQRLAFCQKSLQLFQELGDRQGIATALNELGHVASRQGKYAEAYQLYAKSLALWQEGGDQQGIANTRLFLAQVLHAQNAYREASALGRESLQLFREMDNQRGIALTLSLLAFLASYDQEHREALSLAEESLRLFRQLGKAWEVAAQLHAVAELARRQNEIEHALAYAEESLCISQRVGNRDAMARAYHLLAQLQWKKQGKMVSRPMLERSLALYEELDHQEGVALVLLNMAQEALQNHEYQTARNLLERCFSILIQKEHRPALVENLVASAHLAAAEGRVERAILLLGASDALREAIGRPPFPLQDAYRRISSLGTMPPNMQTFARLWKEGRSMTPEQVFAENVSSVPNAVTLHVLPDSQEQASDPSFPTHLTAREREVLCLLTMGLTNPQIAERLTVSPVTVNAHVRSIYSKLEVTSRSAATRYALLHHLV